jgi:hypothetical protein
VRAADCFVLFDDAHSRGTDLVLGERAHAMVTIGKGMNRDKLVQACMRMRMLNRKQTVEFVGSTEVDTKIRVLTGKTDTNQRLTGVDVMHWVIQNTAESQELAMIEWARQGTLFHKKRPIIESMVKSGDANDDLIELLREDELTSLQATFGSSRSKVPGSVAAEKHILRVKERLSSNAQAEVLQGRQSAEPSFECIRLTAKKYLDRVIVSSKLLEEECEKELEQQVEEEVQRVLPPPEKPRAEMVFDPATLFDTRHWKTSFLPLEHSLKSTSARTFEVRFSNTLRCTSNFAIVLADDGRSADQYLRPVSTVVLLSAPQEAQLVVLLSGQEGDKLLRYFWKMRRTPKFQPSVSCRMFHFPMFSSSISTGLGDHCIADSLPKRLRVELGLFMGQCTYDEELREVVCQVLGIVTPVTLLQNYAKLCPSLQDSWALFNSLRKEKSLSDNGLILRIPDKGATHDVLVDLAEKRCFGSTDAPKVIQKLVEMRMNHSNFDLSDLSNLLNGRDRVMWKKNDK